MRQKPRALNTETSVPALHIRIVRAIAKTAAVIGIAAIFADSPSFSLLLGLVAIGALEG